MLREEMLLNDRFLVGNRLSFGDRGEVFEAFDQSSGELVAVKAPTNTAHGFEVTETVVRGLFRREIELLARVKHQRVVQVIEFNLDGDQPYLVTEYLHPLPYPTIRTKRDPLPFADLPRVGKALAEVLGAVHQAGVIHRDLTPTNIMCRRNGELVLVDFGLAMPSEPDEISRSEERMLRVAIPPTGTPGFYPPEVALKRTIGSELSDIWSLGALLFFWATGELPIDLMNSQQIQLTRILREVPDKGFLPGYSRGLFGEHQQLFDVLSRALARLPSSRVSSAADFKRLLDELD